MKRAANVDAASLETPSQRAAARWRAKLGDGQMEQGGQGFMTDISASAGRDGAVGKPREARVQSSLKRPISRRQSAGARDLETARWSTAGRAL
jgi:hypothetical protein